MDFLSYPAWIMSWYTTGYWRVRKKTSDDIENGGDDGSGVGGGDVDVGAALPLSMPLPPLPVPLPAAHRPRNYKYNIRMRRNGLIQE